MAEETKKSGITTDEIMNFLVEHMVTKEELQYELNEIREDMVSKDEFTLGLGKLRSDMIDHMNKNTLQLETTFGIMMRAEDHKVGALVNLLANKNVISSQEAGMILKLEPFPKM